MTFNSVPRLQNYILNWLYNRFLELIIYPSIWVALAIASLGIYASQTFDLEPDWQPILLIFFTALIPYNLDRIFDSYVQTIPDERAQLFFRKPYVLILLFIAIAGTAWLLYNAPPQVKYVSIAGIVPLLYGAPVLPFKRKQWQWYRLKDIPGSKAWIVGSVLTYAVVAIPLAYAGKGVNFSELLITLFLFIFIVTNSHIFDLRDLESDREKGVVTLPIMIGVKGTKVLLTIMNIAIALIVFIAWNNNAIAYHLEIILAAIVNLFYVALINTNAPRWVYSIIIEGCLFAPLLFNLAFGSTAFIE